MPYLLEDLVVDRVDLVDEGANSAAFIELYKRKEQNEMGLEDILKQLKPEHATVIQDAINKAAEDLKKAQEELEVATNERDEANKQLETANEDLAATKSELDTLKAEGTGAGTSFDEATTMKSMPEDVRAMFETLQAQKVAAEEELRKAKDAEQTAQAVAKANEFKAIPVEHDKLVNIIKRADADVLDLLIVVNAAIEGTVLDEVGKSNAGAKSSVSGDAWAKIEGKADEVAKRDNVTKAKAIATVIKENPELYKEYLDGGAN